MELSEDDLSILSGAHGPAAAEALDLVVSFGKAAGAQSLIGITGAHIDGCLFHGDVCLDFVNRFVALGGRVAVPTSLNVGSVDLIHPELFIGTPELGQKGKALMEAHVALGCTPTFTCAPYQTLMRPRLGEQVAWAESNAIVFANSVIGARTARYGDFIDLACALSGRAPSFSLHVPENRHAKLTIEIVGEHDAGPERAEQVAVAVGLFIGAECGETVPVIDGLPLTTSEDALKALGAAAASSGSVAMFHAVGLTPEAPDLVTAGGGIAPPLHARLTGADLDAILAKLSTVPDGSPITAAALGTPHFSAGEFARLMPYLDLAPFAVPIYVNTGRDVFAALQASGDAEKLARAGITIVADTCTYVTAIIRDLSGAVMTNSGKWAWYAPANLGIDAAFGSLGDVMHSAKAGRIVRSGARP